MGILSWIIIGGLAGWLAGVILKGGGSGIIMNIVVGIVGAFIGGLIMNFIGGIGFTGFDIRSFLVALLGSVILLVIVGAVTRRRV